MSVVVCKLPKAGLGNQLFPLMHALVFAKLNRLPVIVTGYHSIKLGPWIRGEKRKRNYHGYFTFEKSRIGEWRDRIQVKRLRKTNETVVEPEVTPLPDTELQDKLFLFSETGDYHDYFRRLKAHRQEVIDLLYSVIHPSIIHELNEKETPVISAHIRMGDFRPLQEAETYQSGHVRPPQSLFVELINQIRKINGKDLAVSVFTDGYRSELGEIFRLKNTSIVETKSDLVDLLLLSKSSLIIPTHGSTFSTWAVFLSESIVVLPFSYKNSLRPGFVNEKIYEGEFQDDNDKMVQNIKSIGQKSFTN
jgi:hypothetical protein